MRQEIRLGWSQDKRSVVGVLVAGALAIAPGVAWAQGTGAATPAARSSVTFAKDVAPILQQKCQVCHRPGSMAPMSLLSYEDVRPWARSIGTRVAAREMPPWAIDKTVGIQKFKNDRSLSQDQIDTIVRWVDSGAPLGNPADMPPPVKWRDDGTWELGDSLGAPDLVVKSTPYTMPAQSPDEWWRPVVDMGLTEDRWLRAIEVKPSAQGRKIVHHASTFLYQNETVAVVEARNALRRGEGSVEAILAALSKSDGPVVEPTPESAPQFSEWAIGKQGEVYADDTGKLMKAGAKMGFEVHYHAVGEAITDSVEVGLWFYPKGVVPKYEETYVGLASAARDLQIPPGKMTVNDGYTVLPAATIIQSFQPHMHLRGKAFLQEAIFPDGHKEILNYVPHFSFNWMVNYIYADDAAPVLPKGTIIHNVAWHDNTAGNKDNPDPRQWVTNGARSIDEMAHTNTQLVYITDADYQRIIEERRKKAAAAATGGQ